MVLAAGWEWQKEETARALARLAVDESGIGVYEHKVAKIRSKTRGSLWNMRGAKTCGIVEEDPEKGMVKFAKPMGVIANVVPCTNPESTICALGVGILKTRNAMIVSPHPRTQGSSYLTVEHGRKALRKIGAPEDLMQCIKNTSIGEDRRVDARLRLRRGHRRRRLGEGRLRGRQTLPDGRSGQRGVDRRRNGRRRGGRPRRSCSPKRPTTRPPAPPKTPWRSTSRSTDR